jgi:hypothetical protein
MLPDLAELKHFPHEMQAKASIPRKANLHGKTFCCLFYGIDTTQFDSCISPPHHPDLKNKNIDEFLLPDLDELKLLNGLQVL